MSILNTAARTDDLSIAGGFLFMVIHLLSFLL